jgi:hypothetical protein
MFPSKNNWKMFFNFKIPGKIPKIIISKFENLILKNSKFIGIFPLRIFQEKMKIFKFFLVLKFSRQKMYRKLFWFNFKIPSRIPKINFFKFENLMLKNSKFIGVFPPLKMFKGKMEIFKFFLVLKFSLQKMFRKLFFLISNFPKLIFPNLKI